MFRRRACYGVATFYSHFAIEPKGKHLVRLCDGTACHVKESVPILRRHPQSGWGWTTSTRPPHDMLFTVETVACLGACGLAPVVVMDDQVHGQMTPESGREAGRSHHRAGAGTMSDPALNIMDSAMGNGGQNAAPRHCLRRHRLRGQRRLQGHRRLSRTRLRAAGISVTTEFKAGAVTAMICA